MKSTMSCGEIIVVKYLKIEEEKIYNHIHEVWKNPVMNAHIRQQEYISKELE